MVGLQPVRLYLCIASLKEIQTGSAAELLLQLVDGGFKITAQHKQVIRVAGLDKELADLEKTGKLDEPEVEIENKGEHHLWLFEVPTSKKGKKLEGAAYFDRIPKDWKKNWENKEITKDDWRAEVPTKMSREFKRFINSSNPRFDQLIPYLPFFLYCEQARRWEEETKNIEYQDIEGAEGRLAFVNQEAARMRQNKLYAANRYATVKEDNMAGGRRKFKASAPQALLCFLVDCGYHFALVKGRQAAITTIMMIIAAIESVFRPSYSGVFVVHKKDGTGKKLFRDKYQNTLAHLPTWIFNEIHGANWAAERTTLDFNPGETKTEKLRDASEFVLLSAEDSMVVNGQTPTQTFLDESQNIPTFQELVGEIDPTLYQYNEDLGGLELVRNIYAWATGSSNAIGKGKYEAFYRGLLNDWEAGKETDAWVPVFFNWTCRPGIDREFYDMQRRKYLRGATDDTKGLTPKERLALFSAHYPYEVDDAFMATHKTLFPLEKIKEQKRRIVELCVTKGLGPKYGKFVPLFDYTRDVPKGGWFDHPVIGVRWQEMPEDEAAPVKMFQDRKTNVAWNYFQGTDPIENDGGFSNFSSCVRARVGRRYYESDKRFDIPCPAVCMLNHRSGFPKESFVQCILMGMYYANKGQRACKEVVEINRGGKYVDYKCGPEFDLSDSLVMRAELPPLYRGGQHIYGVDLKGGSGSRKEALYHDGTTLLLEEGHNLFYPEVWTQIQNINVESKPDGSVQWGTASKNTLNDDMVYAMFYAKVCERCYSDKEYVEISPENPQYETRKVTRRDMNTLDFYEVEEKVPVNY